jgi:hypothetical protein
VDNKKTKTKSKTVQLSDLPGDVEPTAPATSVLEDDIDLELLGGSSNRLAL